MGMDPFTFLCITLCMYRHVQSLNVKPVLPTISTTFNATVELQWKVTLEPSETIASMTVRELPSLIGILIGNVDGFNVAQGGTKLFGDRISGIFNNSSNIVTVTLQNIQYDETLTFELFVVSSNLVIKSANVSIEEISGGPTPSTQTPTTTASGGKGGKGGIIAGAVIGGILLVALIVVGVVLFLRWKKNHPSKTDTSEQLKSLKANKPAEEGVHYASTDVTVPPEKRDQQVYAQVDRSGGGGRDGPKPEVVKSDYAQMQVDADGYPASGPTSSTPPDENEDGISSGVVV